MSTRLTGRPVAALSALALLSMMAAPPLVSQDMPEFPLRLPSGVEPLGLARAPGGGVFVTTRQALLRPTDDGFESLRLGRSVDALTVAEPGLAVGIRADTLGIPLIDEEGFQPIAMLPFAGMKPTVSHDGRLFVYGSDPTAPDSVARAFVFEVVEDIELRSVAALAESIVGVAIRGDTAFVASPDIVYRVVGDSLQPFFADRSSLEIRFMSGLPTGSLLLATAKGLFEVAADGSRGRWLTREPVEYVLWTRAAIFFLEEDVLSALAIRTTGAAPDIE